MAESKSPSSTPAKKGAPAPGASGVKLKNLWPIPALIISSGMLVGGIALALASKPKPPPEIPLEQAKALVLDKRYEEAIEVLNSKDVRKFLDFGSPTQEHWQAFYLARARAFAGAQANLNINNPINHQSIIDDYQSAEKAGLELEPTDVSILCESLLATGQPEAALDRIDKLPATEAARRTRLTRAVVDHNLASDDKKAAQTLGLLATLSGDPSITAADRAWVLARQAELLLATGESQEAINKLIRRIGLLKDVPTELQGELYLLLGKAYFQDDQPQQAVRQLDAADQLLGKSTPLRAELGVMLGRLAQSGISTDGKADEDVSRLLEMAKERFESVVADFSTTRSMPRAKLGLAEVEAALRHDNESLEKYAEVIELVRNGGNAGASATGNVGTSHAPQADSHAHGSQPDTHAAAPPHGDPKAAPDAHAASPAASARFRPPLGEVNQNVVHASIMHRFNERFDSGQRESALRYAQLAETLFPDADVPADILLAIGRTRRAIADQLVTNARDTHTDKVKSGTPGVSPDFSIEELDPATRAEVKQNYIIAGDYLRRHAKSVTATDASAANASLWTAADSYDRAGDLEEARKAFSDYADVSSDNDPQKPAARYRLAQVFHAKGDFAAAAALYRGLVDARGSGDPSASAGTWSDLAIVPLAKCLLDDNDRNNDQEAERLLISVVDGSTMTPDAAPYRDALIELGTMYYAKERYAEAIGWLEQAAKRYKEDRRIDSIRYRLADAHRLEGIAIARTLQSQKLPQSQVDEFEAARIQHLRSARSLYDEVRVSLESKDQKTLNRLERIHLRNSYFNLGDCSMEIKDYDGAIFAYDAARLKYADDPASLVAMAQIVTAYAAQEKWAEARTANERARQQLQKFPESVWANPDLPMEKRHWERWLDARTIIEQQRAGAPDGESRKSE